MTTAINSDTLMTMSIKTPMVRVSCLNCSTGWASTTPPMTPPSSS